MHPTERNDEKCEIKHSYTVAQSVT